MTHNLSFVVGNHGFTPRTAFVGPVRGLSIQRARQHQREIPARQRFQRAGKAQHFGRVGVGHRRSVFCYADGFNNAYAPTCNATCNSVDLHQFC